MPALTKTYTATLVAALFFVTTFANSSLAAVPDDSAHSTSSHSAQGLPADMPYTAPYAAPDLSGIPSADALYYSEPGQSAPTPSLQITRPPLQALITIENNLDPFGLDSLSARPVRLPDVVDTAMQNNLAIKISSQGVLNDLWKLRNAYTGFLPNAKLGFMYDYLQGHVKFPVSFTGPGLAGIPLHIASPFIIAQAGVNYNVFQGGKVLFGALQSRNNLRAARWDYSAATNDVLLEASKRYYNLLLSEALLQIRIRAVETSKEQLRLNTDLETNGKATRLDVLQATSQLANDRQSLIEQQVSRRNAAIQLAEYLNLDQSVDLIAADTVVNLVPLITPDVTPGKLLIAAAEHRPELKSYRQKWLAAKKGIVLAAAPLWPTVQLSATEYGTGETLNNSTSTVLTGPGGTVPTPGTPVYPTTVSKQIVGLGVIGLNANWNINAFGLSDFTNVMAARATARQAMLQSNQEANTVLSQVRQSYLNQLSDLRRSEESLARINSSAEELRLSRLRMDAGLSKNLDVLRAQQDLIDALVQHAQAVIDFNIAQVQLLHDLGLISRDTLVSSAPLKL